MVKQNEQSMQTHGGDSVDKTVRARGAVGRVLGYDIQKAAVHANLAMLRKALDEGGNPRSRAGDGGYLPLHLACGARQERSRGLFSAVSVMPPARDGAERCDCVMALLKAGAGLEDRDSSGRTALHWAAAMGLPELSRLLIDKGSDVEAVDNKKSTPLMTACARHDGYKEGGVEDVLLDAGASLGVRDRRGEEAIHKAASNPGAIVRLARAGANLDAQDKAGRTALRVAVELNRATSARLLLEHGADPTLADAKGRAPSDVGLQGAASHVVSSACEAARIFDHINNGPAGEVWVASTKGGPRL